MSSDSDDEAWWDLLTDVAMHKDRKRGRRKRAQAAAAAAAAEPLPRSRKKRAKEEHKRLVFNEDAEPGSLEARRNNPGQSPWWKLIKRRGVREPGTRAYYKFRNKFRLPLTEVERLVEQAQSVPAFKDKPAGAGNGRGPPRFPLIIKVLAALRCLAKGCDVDAVEEAACVSAARLTWFVPMFIQWMSETIFPIEVRLPQGEHLDKSLQAYERLGFPGAYCEADGVHLHWEACPAMHKGLFKGKEKHPSVAFNVSALHTTEIIHVADWLPGTKNDKTQAVHDMLFDKLRTGQLHPEKTYYLYGSDGTAIQCKGLYAIVDGGYHEWRVLQCPLRVAAGDDAIAWKERLESVRKAVERTFGILKKRFRILRNSFVCQKPEQISSTFRACCALHNIILRHDERDTLGHDDQEWWRHGSAHMNTRLDVWRDRGTHVVRGPRNVSAANSQREPGHVKLREQLITHFGQALARKELCWPKTAAQARPRMHWSEVEAALNMLGDDDDHGDGAGDGDDADAPDVDAPDVGAPSDAEDAEDEEW